MNTMRSDWLWDRKIGISEARDILKNPKDSRFILTASLLLARKAEPKEVFKCLNPMLFCENWQMIKKRMKQDKWNLQRIIFWQAIYEKLLEKYRKSGLWFNNKKEPAVPRDPFFNIIGEDIRKARKKAGLSQHGLARKAGMSQQLISRIEKGRENTSLITLKKIASAFGKDVSITFL
jgi:DNA-binding XRE family transcriptional regulator